MIGRINHFILGMFEGLDLSTAFYKLYQLDEEAIKGNSPNRNNLFINRFALNIAFFLPSLRMKDNPAIDPASLQGANYASRFPLQHYSSLIGLFNLAAIILFEVVFRAVRWLDRGNFIRRWTYPLLRKIDQAMPKYLFASSFAFIGIAMAMGAWFIPLSYLFFIGAYYIQSKNLYSQNIRSKIDWVLFWGSTVAGVLFGSIIEKVLFAYLIVQRTGSLLERAALMSIKGLKAALNFLLYPLPNWMVKPLNRQLKTFADRLSPVEVKPFKLEANFDTFVQTIEGLAAHPKLRVNKAFVQNNDITLPFLTEGVDGEELLTIFDLVDLAPEWEKNHPVIVQAIKTDWHLREDEFNAEDKAACRVKLRVGLESFIRQIKSGDLPGTMPGSQPRYERYLNAITFMIKKNIEAQNYPLVIELLIKLGIEGGKNCSVAKASVLEDVYLCAVAQDASQTCLPTSKIAGILQANREVFFQIYIASSYWFAPFRGIYNKIYDPQDRHGYNAKISIVAPRLGLPSFSAQTDATTQSDFASFFASFTSICEQQFWLKTTSDSIMEELHDEVGFERPFTIADIERWYADFLSKHNIGDEEQCEELRLTTQHHNCYKMDRDYLALMLLDMGVLHLKGDNTLRAKPVLPQFESASSNNVEVPSSITPPRSPRPEFA